MYEDEHLESDYEDKYTIQGDWDAEDESYLEDDEDDSDEEFEEDEDPNLYILTN
jgi:hypothetical protein